MFIWVQIHLDLFYCKGGQILSMVYQKDISMYINQFTAHCLAMQSSDNGTLIGGSVGGVCLLIAIIGACILISKTRRPSFPGLFFNFPDQRQVH